MKQRLLKQMEFIKEADRLKTIYRQTLVSDGSKRENDAEHSWHLALMAMLLQEHAAEPVDLLRVIKMVLIHDLVEIDAGDTFCYDQSANADKEEREHKAAQRLFAMLPEDQGREMWELWQEFEDRETAEALFAAALDRLQPMLNNAATGGGTWTRHDIASSQVRKRGEPIVQASASLGEYFESLLEQAMAEGILRSDENSKGEAK